MSKTLVEKLSDLLKKHDIKGVKLSATEVKMAKEGKLADGTMVATPQDDFVVGSELYVFDADGNPQPAPDGEHTLESGEVVVTAGGIITEVKSATEEEMSAEVQQVLDALSNRLSEVENQLATKSTELSKVQDELKKSQDALAASQKKVTELSKKAAAPSVKEDKTGNAEPEKQTFSAFKNKKENKAMEIILAKKAK